MPVPPRVGSSHAGTDQTDRALTRGGQAINETYVVVLTP